MLADAVECTIERRLLVNYRIDPEVVERHLPAPFVRSLCRDGRSAECVHPPWKAVDRITPRQQLASQPRMSPTALPLNGMTTAGTQVGVYHSEARHQLSDHGSGWGSGLSRYHGWLVRGPRAGSELRLGVESRDGTVGLSVTASENQVLGGELFTSSSRPLTSSAEARSAFRPAGHPGV